MFGLPLFSVQYVINTMYCFLITLLIFYGFSHYHINHKSIILFLIFEILLKPNLNEILKHSNVIMGVNLITTLLNPFVLLMACNFASLVLTHHPKMAKLSVKFKPLITPCVPCLFNPPCFLPFGIMHYKLLPIYTIQFPLNSFHMLLPLKFSTKSLPPTIIFVYLVVYVTLFSHPLL